MEVLLLGIPWQKGVIPVIRAAENSPLGRGHVPTSRDAMIGDAPWANLLGKSAGHLENR